MSNSHKSLEELLVLRSQWEEIVKRYRIPEKNGTLDTLRWFIKNGKSNNRFRRWFDEARIIIILKIALPEVVPTPKAKLSNSPSIIRLKSVVKSSGIELPTAFIVAPRTPSVRFRPR